MGCSIEEVLEARQKARTLTVSRDVEEKAREARSLGYFEDLGSAVEYVCQYRGEFDEVDGSVEYAGSYKETMGNLDGIMDTLDPEY